MENESPVLFRERIHITQFFRTWLAAPIFICAWGVCPIVYGSDPLKNESQAALCIMFSSLWTTLPVLMIFGWKNHILTEVRPNGIFIYSNFWREAQPKLYPYTDIQHFELRRWPFENQFNYGWPFRNHLYLMNRKGASIGVRLTLNNGRKVFIETHRPDEFMAALEQMKQQWVPPPAPINHYPPE